MLGVPTIETIIRPCKSKESRVVQSEQSRNEDRHRSSTHVALRPPRVSRSDRAAAMSAPVASKATGRETLPSYRK